MRKDVTEAEVIVYFAANYDDIEGMSGLTGDLMACISYQGCNPLDNCTLETYRPYTATISEIFKEMLALRDGKPTIIRAMNFYNPYISGHARCGVEMETGCTHCWTTFNDSIRLAAEANNIPLVSVYDWFNGVNHDEDPREKEYIGAYGFFPSKEGAMAIANQIREAGYEPVVLP